MTADPSTQAPTCPRCAGAHTIVACPNVKAVELEHGGDFGSVKRVEFMVPIDFPRAPAAQGGAIDGSYPKLGEKR